MSKSKKQGRHVRPLTLFAAASAALAATKSSHADNLYWDGASGTAFNLNTAWSTDPNAATPDPVAAPGSGDIATFNISTLNSNLTASVTANINVAGFIFNNTGTTLLSQTSNRVTLIGASGILVNSGAGAVTLGQSTASLGVTVNATQSWTNNSSSVLNIRNAMSNAANQTNTLTLTGSGSGGFIFSNTIAEGTGGTLSLVVDVAGTGNASLLGGTYTGGFLIKRGTATAGNNTSFGTGAALIGDTSGNGNVSVNFNASGNYANNITVQSGSTGTATIRNSSNNPVLTGALTLNKDTIFDLSSTLTAANTIAGNGNITLASGGTLILGSGGTTGGLNSGTVVSGNGRIGFNRSDNVSFSNTLIGNIGITQQGTGTTTLANANTYTNGTTVSGGRLVLGNVKSLGLEQNALNVHNAAAGSAPTLDLNGKNAVIGTLAGNTGVVAGQIINDGATPATLTMGFANTTGTTYNGTIADGTSITAIKKIGQGSQTFAAPTTYTGGTLVQGTAGGTLRSTATSGTPFGTGNITLQGATLTLAPSAAGDTSLTGSNATVNSRFNYAGGSTLALTRNTATSSVTFTVGDSGATSSVLAREGRGTLSIKPSSNTSNALGAATNGERFIVNGPTPAVTNGIVNPSIVGIGVSPVVSVTNVNANAYDFLTYGANGFVKAAYTRTLSTAGTYATAANEILEVAPTGAGVIIQDTGNHAYALKIDSSTASPTISGTVTIGNGTGQAGLILNTLAGAGNPTLLGSTSGRINFGSAEGVVHVAMGSGYTTLGVPLSGSAGVTFSGNGNLLVLNSGNNFTGGVTFNTGFRFGGAAADGVFGDVSNAITFNGGGFNGNNGALSISTSRSVLLTESGAIFDGNNSFITFAGNITGTGNGSGVIRVTGFPVTLTGNNSIGGYDVAGNLNVASDANLGGANSSLHFNGGQLNVMGNTLTSFGTHAVNFTGATTFNIQNSANEFTVDRVLTLGAGALTKTGPGTLTLTTSTTHTGGTTISGGTLKVDASQGGVLTSGSAPTFSGGKLQYVGKSTGSTAQTLGNVTVNAGGGDIVVDGNGGSGTTLTLGTLNPSAAGSTLNIATTGAATVTANTAAVNSIVGNGRVTFDGKYFATNTGAGTALSTYTAATAGVGDTTAGTTVNYGLTDSSTLTSLTPTYANTLRIDTSAAGNSLDLNGNTLTLTTGAILFAGNHNYAINSGSLVNGLATNPDLIIHTAGDGDLTIGATILNGATNSALTKTGPGRLILTAANTNTGQTFINEGILSIASNTTLNNGAGTQININGGTLQTTATMAMGRAIVLGGAGGTFDITNSSTLTLSNAISGNALTVSSSDNGAGVLVVNGTNTFGSGVTINSGTLRAGSSNALGGTVGNNTLTFGAGTTPRLQLNGQTLAVTGAKSSNSTAVIENGNGNTTAATLTVNTGDDQTFVGIIRDRNNTTDTTARALSITKGGGGTWTLSGNNTFTGTTRLMNGTILLDSANALSATLTSTTANTVANDIVFGSGTVGATNGGTLKFSSNNTNDYSARIKGSSAPIAIDTNGQDLTFGSSLVSTNTGGLTKSGLGKLSLNGTNAYLGTTTVNAGTLAVNGSTAGGAVIVNSSATLAGNLGTINGAVTINSGATIAPGNSPGVLTLASNLTMSGTYDWEFTNNVFDEGTAGTHYDQIVMTNSGAALVLGGTVNVSLTSGNYATTFWNTDKQWKIIDAANPATPGGTLPSIVATGSAGQGTFSVTTSAGDVFLNWDANAAVTTVSLTSNNAATANPVLTVNGDNGSYLGDSEDVSGNTGGVRITGFNPVTDSPVVIALDLEGLAGTVADFLATVTAPEGYTLVSATATNGNVPSWVGLTNQWSQSSSDWEAILAFAPTTPTGSPFDFNWDFSADPTVTVDRIAVVPEPGALGLAAVGVMGLISQRRRRRL